jgi:hypothetical protein
MPNTNKTGGRPVSPHAGESAVEFKGTYVHADHKSGVTRPAHGTHGSHDDRIREHADHED